jgi:flagellar FliL protein
MAEKPEETPQEKPKRGKIFIILGAVLILVIVGDVAFRVISYFRTPQQHPAEANTGAKPGHDAEAKKKKPEVKSTLSLDSFLVNLADKEEVRFVKAQFQLGMAESNEEMAKDPVILAATRDTIISLLSSKTSEQIMTPQGKDQLREEIRNRVNAILPKGKVSEVFIVDFVVQL